jgi:diguanylate cyclase (GGDEF)-like protein
MISKTEFIQFSRPFWPVAAILLVTVAAVWVAPPLPPSYAGLRTAGPYAVLLTAMGLAWWFNRGRSFVVAASLLLGWAMYHYNPGKVVYTALVVLVPLNCLIAFSARERGARYGPAYRWFALLGIEILLLLWLGNAAKAGLFGHAFEHWALRSPPTPLVGRVMFAAAFAGAIWRAYPDHKPLQIADAGALAAFFIGAEWGADPRVFAAFMTAAGAMLIVALVQESHQLAFRDQLTGLLARRALEERLRSLGARYVLAMVDVDHFKKFNDTHGHDVGDQVLKLVAARLAQVGGGGIAYRYGGEEFSVLFPERDVEEASLHLEAIRGTIEGYKMAVRGEDRPKNPDDSQKLRLNKAAHKTLSVTVSIGVAQPGDARRTPVQVLKAADEALYRAKQSGRNRVST